MPASSAGYNTALASPDLPGDRPISTSQAAEALDFLLDECGFSQGAGNADMLIQYVSARYRKGEIDGARKTLLSYVDLTAVYRIEAILHVPRPDENDALVPLPVDGEFTQ